MDGQFEELQGRAHSLPVSILEPDPLSLVPLGLVQGWRGVAAQNTLVGDGSAPALG